MAIETVERFVTMGREFRTYKAAFDFRFDRVGEFLDPALSTWGPGAKLKLVQYLVDNRDKVRELLDF